MTREQLLLICIAEEFGEVAKELVKGVRFGMHSTWHENRSNLDRANEEWSQLHALLDIYQEEYGVRLQVSELVKQGKREQFERFYQHSLAEGRVERTVLPAEMELAESILGVASIVDENAERERNERLDPSAHPSPIKPRNPAEYFRRTVQMAESILLRRK